MLVKFTDIYKFLHALFTILQFVTGDLGGSAKCSEFTDAICQRIVEQWEGVTELPPCLSFCGQIYFVLQIALGNNHWLLYDKCSNFY